MRPPSLPHVLKLQTRPSHCGRKNQLAYGLESDTSQPGLEGWPSGPATPRPQCLSASPFSYQTRWQIEVLEEVWCF